MKNIFIDEKLKREKVESIIEKIKFEGSRKKYDCIIGLSGGIDSSDLAYKVVELGLRPLKRSILTMGGVQN